ncbi:MAG: hypothetical protein KDA42_19380 [Planctomycetales bacterium]|nr:hypothetical protein [Planctomycetales bacterium]
MRVLLAHNNGSNLRDFRQALLGAGLSCTAEDCVSFQDLPVRLAQRDADLVVLKTDAAAQLDWRAVREATSLTMAPIMAVGPMSIGSDARQAGVAEYVDELNLRAGLDEALDRLSGQGGKARRRGRVISVVAPTDGSGATTVALNFAASLAGRKSESTGLIEMSRAAGKLALAVDFQPQHWLGEVCSRWKGLDLQSLETSFHRHECGLQILAADVAQNCAAEFHADAVRRIAVLARVAFDWSILRLDGALENEEIEAMRLSDAILLVVRPDVPSVRRAQTTLAKLTEEGIARERLRLVVNRWGQPGQLESKQIETSMGLPIFHFVADDPRRVNRSVNRGVLLSQLSSGGRIVRNLAALAKSLAKELEQPVNA